MTQESSLSKRVPLPPRILIVDDEVDFCRSLERVLTQLPARVESVHNGNDAVERLLTAALGEDRFKLVILDMWVPREASGPIDEELGMKILIDLQEHYQLMRHEVPIIVFTNHPSYEACAQCIMAGAVSYIPKADLEAGQENVEKLFNLSREVLTPLEETPSAAFRQWLDDHIGELIENHGGNFVGLVPVEAAQKAGLTGTPIGRYVPLPGPNGDSVRLRILSDRILRWEIIRIILIPEREERRNA